ncbi:MAG: DUF87 domain-containing protein [Candidatus Blackburnbacteria bacterium]|nr:DUF87 domain-containing protein [Candidatus Blackburnbacteria bacterium]
MSSRVLELRPDRNSEVGPEAMAQVFSGLAGRRGSFFSRLFKREKPFVLEIVSVEQKTHFFVWIAEDIAPYFEGQVTAQYPKLSIAPGRDALSHHLAGKSLSFGSLKPSSSFYLPLKTYRDFTDSDPLASILGIMTKVEKDDVALVQLVLLPTGGGWRNAGARAAAYGGGVGPEGEKRPHPKASFIEKKISQNGFRTGIRLLVASPDKTKSGQLLSQLAGAFGVLTLGESNSLVFSKPRFYNKKGILKSILERSNKFIPGRQILTVDELATIFHFPAKELANIRNISWGAQLLGEAPEGLPVALDKTDEERQGINFFARTEFKNKPAVFGIKRQDRRRHMYVIGKTGTGKTTLIANMAINDIKNGEGVAVVDPHGDLSEILLDYIPSHRINDVAYLDAALASKRPFRMNLFEVQNPEQAELVASGVVAIFQKLYGFSWGPRLEYILRNSILSLVGRPNATLVDVPRMLTDYGFRKRVTQELDDPVLRNFWEREFEGMTDKLRAESISPILNKVGQFVSSPTIREIVGYPTSTVSLEEVMNNGKILILNLSQGRLGEDNAALLGAMLITKIQLAAMARSAVAEEKRRDFYLYVDEFQNFATTSFIKILSEARKYRLNLTVANQYIGQIPEDVQKAIFGNVGTLTSFLVGAQDALILTREFGGLYKEEELVNLDNFQVVLKLAVDGRTSRPFFAYTLPLPKSKNQNRDKVIRVSQERYTKEAKSGQAGTLQRQEPQPRV